MHLSKNPLSLTNNLLLFQEYQTWQTFCNYFKAVDEQLLAFCNTLTVAKERVEGQDHWPVCYV